MTKKERDALKKAFEIPDPLQADSFVQRKEFTEEKESRRRIFLFSSLPSALRYGTVVLAAAAVIGVWGGFRNWSSSEKFRNDERTVTTDTVVVTSPEEETTAAAKDPEDSLSIVTAVSSSENAPVTVTTTAAGGTASAVTTGTAQEVTASGTAARQVTTTAGPASARTTTPVTTTGSGRQTSATAASTTVVTATQTTVSTATTGVSEWQPQTTSQRVESDLTVIPEVTYTVTGEIVPASSLGNSTDAPGIPKELVPSVSELRSESDALVEVRVDEVLYTSENGQPVTQENVTVQGIFYGGLGHGSRISIRSNGGYIPASEYSGEGAGDLGDVFIYDSGGNKKQPKMGDIYLCFIREDSSGAYWLVTGDDMSKFTFDVDTKSYVNCHDSYDTYTYNAFIEALSD